MPRALPSRRRAALLLLVPIIPLTDPGSGEAQQPTRPPAAGPARQSVERVRRWRLTYDVEQAGSFTASATAQGPDGPVTVTMTTSYRFTCNGSALLVPD